MVVVAAAKPHVAAIVRRHNAILRAAHARIDGSLEEKLAALIQPILEKGGNQAAARFQKLATNHLTAALRERADQQALQRIAPGLAADGFFGYRLRPFALTAAAPTPNSAMICVKPRPDEAADIAWPGGEIAESLHVTLVYLGPVDGSLQEIADALAPVAASHAPLEGVVGGVGKFQPPGVAILLPDVPGLVELRVAVTEALVEQGIFYSRDHGFEAHVSIDAAPDPDTLEEALARTAQKPLHFDSILIVRGDSEVVEVPLIGPRPVTASGLCARCNGIGGLGQAGEICRDGQLPTMACPACSFAFSLAAAGEHVGWTGPAGDELIDVDKLVASLRTKTDPVRMAVLKSSMDPALEAAGISFDVSNPLTAKVLAQSGSQVKGIAETTQLNVMRIIDRSYNQGLSIPDTAKAIRAGMSSASDYRARTIARTELAGAANGGSLAATMLAADALGVGFYKQWLCVAPWTRVAAAGVLAAVRKPYEGELVTITARPAGRFGGPAPAVRSFSVTPDHLVLTQRGWLPAGLVDESDQVVGGIFAESDAAGQPDVNDIQPTIEEIFDAAADRLAAVGMMSAPVYLDDGRTGEKVDVVTADSGLSYDLDATLGEPLRELMLSFSDVGLDELLRGSPLPDGFVGHLGSAPGGIPEPRPRQKAVAVTSSAQNISLALRPDPCAVLNEDAMDGTFGAAETPSESLLRFAGLIRFDDVVGVERREWTGHVYDLTTLSGWFFADGYVAHNTAPGAPHPRHEEYEGLDGQTVGLEDAFDVGGESLQFPGDPAGEPAETINCRCALAYTETPPEGAAVTAEPEDGLTSPVVDRIKALGLDKPLKDVRPTTEIGREVYARGPTTEDLFKQGGEWTQERQQIHADIVAKHFAIWKDMPNLDWQLFDNTDTRVLVAEKKAGEPVVIHDRAKWDQILAKANETSAAPGSALGVETKPVEAPAVPVRTVADIIPGPDAERLAHVQSYQQTRLDNFAANYPVGQFGTSVNEIRGGYRAAVDQKIADLTAAAEVRIRVTPHILDKIVDDGRFKSQFEVEHSGGAFNRILRSQAEQTMFGYSRDLPVEERPIYGYLFGSTSEDGSISQYGPIVIRLTDAAAKRATFTLTDSLGAGERRELVPVALADGQVAGKTDAFSTYTTKDPLKATSLDEISDVYAEAQVHGGVTLADIAEVILPKEEIAYRLEGLNRDIGLLEDRVTREQRFIDIHGEAAAQVSARQSIARLSARLADYQAQAALLVDDAAALRAKLATAGIKATLS